MAAIPFVDSASCPCAPHTSPSKIPFLFINTAMKQRFSSLDVKVSSTLPQKQVVLLTAPGHFAGIGVRVRQPPGVQHLRPLFGNFLSSLNVKEYQADLVLSLSAYSYSNLPSPTTAASSSLIRDFAPMSLNIHGLRQPHPHLL